MTDAEPAVKVYLIISLILLVSVTIIYPVTALRWVGVFIAIVAAAAILYPLARFIDGKPVIPRKGDEK